MPNDLHARFALDPSITFLNHGSFGACPREVLAYQSELRARLEADPVQFFVNDLQPMLDQARETVARFVGARPEDLAFVRNATTGVNSVVQSLRFDPGDELLITDHGYSSNRNVLQLAVDRWGARVVVARVPFPLTDPAQVVDAILAATTAKTRLALIDHITSPTGLVFPIERIVERLAERGVDVLVDGAHAPGQVALDLERLGAAYFTGNLHKWLSTPKGCGILYVRRDRQRDLHPAVLSHGFSSPRARPRLWEEFDYTGTDDPTPWLCAPRALEVLSAMAPGGMDALRARYHTTAIAARDRMCDTLGIAAPAPDSMIAALVSVPLPDGEPGTRSAWDTDPLQQALYDRHRIQIPIHPWPSPPHRLIRVSCPVYVELEDIERLCTALRTELPPTARSDRTAAFPGKSL